jgi:subtilisin family serine protease
VINCSLGVQVPCKLFRQHGEASLTDPMSCEKRALCQVVTELADKGVMIVAAVGNEPGKCALPAGCRQAMAVGATTSQGTVASYSGASPDLVALGETLLFEQPIP